MWRRHALDGVRYHRTWTYRRGFPGEQLTVRIEVENRKLLPISWLRVVDNWPQAAGPADNSILRASHLPEMGELINLYSLRWYQRIERQYLLTLRQRGTFLVGPAEASFGRFVRHVRNQPGHRQRGQSRRFPGTAATEFLPTTHSGPFWRTPVGSPPV